MGLTKDEKKMIEKQKELNETCFEEPALAIDTNKKKGRVIFDILPVTKMDDYPDGDIGETRKCMKSKYMSKKPRSRVNI